MSLKSGDTVAITISFQGHDDNYIDHITQTGKVLVTGADRDANNEIKALTMEFVGPIDVKVDREYTGNQN